MGAATKIISRGILAEARVGTDGAALTFPTITCLADSSLLATWRAGSGKDSEDEHIEFSRSTDLGLTWSEPVAPFGDVVFDGRRGTLKICYLTEVGAGTLSAAAMWVDRDSFPGKPLFNPETEGCLPMAILLSRSGDGGGSWTDWAEVPLPVGLGPPSLTSPLLIQPNGAWLISVETNKSYLDNSVWKQKAVLVRSHDEGNSWSAPQDVAVDHEGRIFNWDLRCGTAPDGAVATFAWTYDRDTNTYLNIHRRLSRDAGATWTAPEDLGFTDQAGRPAMLSDGRVLLPWVDRFHSRTIKARLSAAIDAPFAADSEVELFAQTASVRDGGTDTGDLLAEMSLWTFGLPYAEALPDGTAIVCYYAGVPDRMSLHWVRLSP